MALTLTIGGTDQSAYIRAQSMSLKLATFDLTLVDPAVMPVLDDAVELTDPAWSGTVKAVEISDAVERGAHVFVRITAGNDATPGGGDAPFGLSDTPDNATTFGYRRLITREVHNLDDTVETSGSCTVFEPGLEPGQTLAITSANHGFAADEFTITEVVTTWPTTEANPVYAVSFGSPIVTLTDWVRDVGGGGGAGGGMVERPGGVIEDGAPLTTGRVDWYYVATTSEFFATDPVAWVAEHLYRPGELISEGGFWFARDPGTSRLSDTAGNEPDWGTYAAGDEVPDAGGYWLRLPDLFDPTDTVPAWAAATDFDFYVRANGAIYAGSPYPLATTGASEPAWVNNPCAGVDSFYVSPDQGDPDPLYALARPYVPGSIYAYNDGVHITAPGAIVEFAPDEGIVTIYSKVDDDDVILVHYAAVC